MIERYTRCVNCCTVYLWNSYARSSDSSETYCPECKRAINEALRKIPLKFESRRVPTAKLERYKDVTWADIEAWEADLAEERKTRLVAQRIGVGLFNLRTGDHQSVRWVRATRGPHQGVSFYVTSWDNDPEKTIELEMEYDLENGCFTGRWWGDHESVTRPEKESGRSWYDHLKEDTSCQT